MSWKGFKKAVTRLPQQVLQKAGYAEETYDEEFEELEAAFKEMEQSSRVLADEAVAYVTAVKTLMAEQIHLGQAFQQLMALSSDPPTSEHLGGMEAYVTASTTWSDTMAPYLDQTLQSVVVDPAAALVVITKQARSMLEKRGRKVVDYDRTRNALKKAKEKLEMTSSADVSKVTKAEIEFEEARREYEGLNNKLKTEIPQLMHLRVAFMSPLLEALLSFQIYFFEQGAASLQGLQNHVALTLPIHETFVTKRTPTLQFLTGLSLVLPIRLDPSADPSTRNDFHGNALSSPTLSSPLSEEPPAYSDDASSPSRDSKDAKDAKGLVRRATLPSNSSASSSSSSSSSSPFPPSSFSSKSASSSASASASASSSSSFSPTPAPAPRPLSQPSHMALAVALYPYHSDTPGDLSFERDEKIHVLQKTDNQQDWWVGRIGSREGSFPANYVRLL